VSVSPAVARAAAVAVSPVAHAAACGDYHCGHLSRSSSTAVKRAVFLYAAECSTVGSLVRRSEAPEVLAALALLREGAECARILAAATGALAAEVAALTAAAAPTRLSPEVLAVMDLVTEGLSYPEIADRRGIATETVRSHVKRAMRSTATHTAVDAAVALCEEGLI
jgi:DNA-binding NarL/FixJ family response regulator